MIGEPVTVLRPTMVTDRYGDQVASWDAPASHVVEHCAVNPVRTSEDNDGRTAVIAGITVYMPTGTDIAAGDRLEVRGVLYAVDGEPADWRNPFTGWRPGIEVQAVRVEG